MGLVPALSHVASKGHLAPRLGQAKPHLLLPSSRNQSQKRPTVPPRHQLMSLCCFLILVKTSIARARAA